MPTPVRVVLVGCGWFACVAHIPALKRLEGEGRIKLVGLCSRSEASTKRAAGLYARQDLKPYRSLEDVAQDPDVDLVDLTLPIEVMPGAIKLFLSAGKHVISEKPGAPSCALTASPFVSPVAPPTPWLASDHVTTKPPFASAVIWGMS